MKKEIHAVTGAFGYSGKRIARQLPQNPAAMLLHQIFRSHLSQSMQTFACPSSPLLFLDKSGSCQAL
ncbi:MAG: hypothetical protein ACL93V_15830 [Candidatus Electrothrix sp. YB6]